jgi:hypothetical protein
MAAARLGMLIGFAGAAMLSACVPGPALDSSGYDVRAPADDAHQKALFETACGGCHGLDVVTGHQMSRTAWATTVDQMIGKGADLDPDQAAQVTDYLARHYGSG